MRCVLAPLAARRILGRVVAACLSAVAVQALAQTAAPPAAPASPDIVVRAVRPAVRRLPDRTVYALGQDLQATTGSAADVLNQLPSVEVDIDGGVALRGDTHVVILVDGRPSAQFTGSATGLGLQQFPASQIDRIEVMTTPPAEYKAAGSGGVINIVTRRNRPSGWSGSAQVSLGASSRAIGSASVAYTEGPLSLTASVALRRDVKQREVSARTTTSSAASGPLATGADTLHETLRRLTPILKTGADYRIDGRTTVGGSVSHQELSGVRYFDQASTQSAAGTRLRHSDGHEWSKVAETELHIDRTLGREGETVSASVQQSAERERERYAYLNTGALPSGSAVRDTLNLSHDLVKTEGRLDYVLPLPGDRTWKAGYDYERDADNFDNLSADIDAVSGLARPTSTDRFRYHQAVQAGYLSFQGRFGPWTVEPGLRYEHADIDFRPDLRGQPTHRTDEGLYPTVHLERALGERQRLTFAVARRVNRPEPEALDPFADRQDVHNLRAGNPNLRPEETLSWEAGYGVDAKAATARVVGYYRTSHNSVTDLTVVLAPDVILTTKANLARSRSGGAEISANGQLFPRLSYVVSANLFYTQIDASGLGGAGLRSTTCVNGKLNLDYRPTPTDTLQFAVSRSDRRLTPQGYVGAVNLVNVGYRRQLQPALAVVATVSDAFDGQSFVRTVSRPGLEQYYRRHQFGQILYIGLTYSFGRGIKSKKSDFEYDTR